MSFINLRYLNGWHSCILLPCCSLTSQSFWPSASLALQNSIAPSQMNQFPGWHTPALAWTPWLLDPWPPNSQQLWRFTPGLANLKMAGDSWAQSPSPTIPSGCCPSPSVTWVYREERTKYWFSGREELAEKSIHTIWHGCSGCKIQPLIIRTLWS